MKVNGDMIDLEGLSVEREEVDNILADLKADEGLSRKVYTDTVGKLTIGYGHNIDDLGISEHIANLILEEDLATVLVELDEQLPWWKDIPESRRRALANMVFNLGMPRLLKFEKMLRALRLGDGERAATEAIDSKWAKQVGARAWRIATLLK